MRTKLSVFCDRVLETGWLLAAILAPLYFNVLSSRVFEPDKLALVRSIALVMVAAWLIKVIDSSTWGNPSGQASRPRPSGVETARPGFWKRLTSVPLVVPTLFLVASYLLSTILSIAPEISLWGSYMRLQGTYTTYSYIVIFFLMLATLREREQVDRLCSTIILTSLPISLYGILQHYGLDSLPWSGSVTERVASNMGNSIFVAAYLIMAVPLTLARLIDSFSTLLKEQESNIGHSLLAGCYAFVLSVQLICIFFTQSRGPWLGLMAGLYVFMLVGLISLRRSLSDQSPLNRRDIGRALLFVVGSIPLGVVPAYIVLVALRRGWRWLWLGWVIHTVVIASFLVAFNLPALRCRRCAASPTWAAWDGSLRPKPAQARSACSSGKAYSSSLALIRCVRSLAMGPRQCTWPTIRITRRSWPTMKHATRRRTGHTTRRSTLWSSAE